MREGRTRFAIQVAVVLLVFGFLGLAIGRQWKSLPDYSWRFEPLWLLVAGVGMLIYYAVQALYWTFAVRLLGERLEVVAAQAIWGKSLLARYVPGNVLMVVGRVVMAEREGVSRKASLSSVIYENGVNFCAAVIAASYFLVAVSGVGGSVLRWIAVALVPVVLVLLHPRVFRAIADYLLKRLGRDPLPAVIPYGRVLLLVLMYLLSWLLIGAASYAFVRSLYPVSGADLPAVGAAYALAWAVAMVTFISPSGLGTRDGAYALALKSIVPGAVAVAIAVAARIFQTLIEIVYVALVALVARSRGR